MFQNKSLMLLIITVSMVVMAISNIFSSQKEVKAQTDYSWVYIEATADSTGHFKVPMTAISTASCKPRVLGAIAATQADNRAWYSVPTIDWPLERLAGRGEQFFAWRDAPDPMYDGYAIGGRVDAKENQNIGLVIFLKAGVC